MNKSINYVMLAPKMVSAVVRLEYLTRKITLDKGFSELIKLHVSKINGCSYCIQLHKKKAIKYGEEARVSAISNWRETDVFSEKERLCLELAEKLTLISQNEITDELYSRISEHFTDKEYTGIVMMINVINLWNRIAIPFGKH